jgi:hypothetical protein
VKFRLTGLPDNGGIFNEISGVIILQGHIRSNTFDVLIDQRQTSIQQIPPARDLKNMIQKLDN